MKTLADIIRNTKSATVFALLALSATALFAQQQQPAQVQTSAATTVQPQDKKDKIEIIHTAYLTEKINLTTDQSQKFWPMYNEYRNELAELQKQRRANAKTIKDAGGIDNMKDEDVQKLITNEIDIKSRELDLHKKYVVKFQEVISLKQVAKLFAAEEQFKLYLLNQLKNKRANNGGNNTNNSSSSEFEQQ